MRWIKISARLLLFLAVWRLLLKTPLATHYPKFMFFLPLWLIVAFGLYAAIKVLLSVARFPDCTKDYHELMRDIDATKEELLARGVKIKD